MIQRTEKTHRSADFLDPTELRHQGHQAFNFAHACARPPQGRLVSIRDIEAKMWFEKLPILIMEYYEHHNRLHGPTRQAADDVVRLILTGKPIDLRRLRKAHDLPPERLQFVINYVVLQIRCCLLDDLDTELRECRFLDMEGWQVKYLLLDLYEAEILPDDAP